MGARPENQKGEAIIKCVACGAATSVGITTDVTDLGHCLVIVRNVPCHKCDECNEIIHTADVVINLETIVSAVRMDVNEITVVDYSRMVA